MVMVRWICFVVNIMIDDFWWGWKIEKWIIGFWRCSLIMINRYIKYIVILIVDFEYLRKGIEI